MKIHYLFLLLCVFLTSSLFSQQSIDTLLPVRGLCIAAPNTKGLNRFVKFIEEELAPMQVNTLILRVDYNYQYQSHPELAQENPLTEIEIKKLVKACRSNNIQLIPQINLLGHQSWHSKATKLIELYPQFDETPSVKLPEKYEWPNEDGLYCKSYCPLHPEVHAVVFSLVDEIMEVFEAKAFHAGLDEVFYIGEDECPRCSGRDKAELFAGEVTKIRNHLADKGWELWMWGDRLIDGKTTGIGMWEASMNNTHRAIDLIPKDVMICDWHYERADPTAAYFATKGLRVLTCPWRTEEVALQQLQQLVAYRSSSTPAMRDNFQGMLQTIWTSADNFLDRYYGLTENEDTRGDYMKCFKGLFGAIGKL